MKRGLLTSIVLLAVLASGGCAADDDSPVDAAMPSQADGSVCAEGRCLDRTCGEPAAEPTGAHCSGATATCVSECTDSLCELNCALNDTATNPDGLSCAGCISQYFRACLETTACREEYEALRCCSRDHCGEVDLYGADPAGGDCSACNAALEAASLCGFSEAASSCVTESLVKQRQCLPRVP